MSKVAYRDLAAFRFALRQFLSFSDEAALSAGLTTQQYQAMLAIKAHPDEVMTIKQLAQQMLVAQNGAVQLVDRLQAQQLVARTASPTDGRSVLIHLTTSGDELLQSLERDHVAELVRHEPLLAESLVRLKGLGR
jgi:DNA-binding MarR family transcriptional regulator